MDKPERPEPDASATEIQEYLDEYEAWLAGRLANELE